MTPLEESFAQLGCSMCTSGSEAVGWPATHLLPRARLPGSERPRPTGLLYTNALSLSFEERGARLAKPQPSQLVYTSRLYISVRNTVWCCVNAANSLPTNPG